MTDAHCHVRRGETRHFICDPADCEAGVGDASFYGCHPWRLDGFDPELLRSRLAANPDAGVGEIGLDRLRERDIPPRMRAAFETQLGIAAEFHRPVVLHGAKCWGEVVKACMSYASRIPAFLFHGFSRSSGLLPEIAKLNGYVSVGPAILNDHAVNYREFAKTVPEEMLLVESDATAENASKTPPVGEVVAKLAEVRGVSAEGLAPKLELNAARFLSARRAAAVLLAFLSVASSVFAAPQLKQQAEVIVEGELRAKVLAASRGIPPPTPVARTGWTTQGGTKRDIKVYDQTELWRLRAEVGTWQDKRGNVMKLARVISLVPSLQEFECTKEGVEKALDELERDFKPDDASLAAWKLAWGVKGVGRFVKAKNACYWVEFRFAEQVKDADAQKLLTVFEKSVSALTKSASSVAKSMQWWEETDDKFRFLTNLDKAKGAKFIKDSRRLMEALRKSFEFYVPPEKQSPICTVRVYKTLAEYREYRKSTGEDDTMSCGLWDPNREELLVVAENPREAQSTMRHESFHQYLHYATGRGDHADWYNEGHATMFESVKYNSAKNTINVTDEGNRAEWVSRNPAKYAGLIHKVLKLNHVEFCSGNVNDHYVTAWAICYFLERGAYTSEEFEPYRGICAKYLELMDGGASAADATTQAWALVSGRDVSADFLKFWKEKRKVALTAREKTMK